MFLAYLFIFIGLMLLLNALGIFVGHLFSFMFAFIFLAIGFKLANRKSWCPMCSGSFWSGKMRQHMQEHMHMKGDANWKEEKEINK